MSRIFLLHGPSSSGKSTLGKALQDASGKVLWRLSIDTLRDGGAWPTTRFASGELSWPEHRAQAFTSFHAMLGAAADSGVDLIIEHIFDTPHFAEDLRARLLGHDVIFIGLTCPLPELERRETARKDRPLGSAAQDYALVHQTRRYDLTVDATQPPAQNAQRILRYAQSSTRQSEFAP